MQTFLQMKELGSEFTLCFLFYKAQLHEFGFLFFFSYMITVKVYKWIWKYENLRKTFRFQLYNLKNVLCLQNHIFIFNSVSNLTFKSQMKKIIRIE